MKKKKMIMNLTADDIKEIKRQDKLIHTANISEREYGLKGYDTRNPYQRDYARILYSAAFRRLQGKMQILGIETSAFFRNRLTHSLEVAQIAKGIRWQLDKDCYGKDTTLSDMFLLDAAALAHDIGHPAFGHKGERVLNDLLSPNDMHFEGNAQNFRVLRSLEKKTLNLPDSICHTVHCLPLINISLKKPLILKSLCMRKIMIYSKILGRQIN